MGFKFEVLDNPGIKIKKENEDLKEKVDQLEDEIKKIRKSTSKTKKNS